MKFHSWWSESSCSCYKSSSFLWSLIFVYAPSVLICLSLEAILEKFHWLDNNTLVRMQWVIMIWPCFLELIFVLPYITSPLLGHNLLNILCFVTPVFKDFIISLIWRTSQLTFNVYSLLSCLFVLRCIFVLLIFFTLFGFCTIF